MKNSVVVFAIIFSFFSFGQNNTTVNFNVKRPKSKIDTTYISDISDKLIIKLNQDYRLDSYTFKSADGLDNYTIRPNGNYNHFISVDYKFLGFSIGLPKQWVQNQNNDNRNVETTNLSLGFSFFLDKWMYTFYYNRVKGYYVKDWREGMTPDGQSTYPDLTVRRMGGSISYIMNGDRFSYRSFSQQTQIQKKSSGSFIPTILYEYKYSSDIVKGFSEESSDKGLTLSIAMAYQYNMVLLKNLTISGGILSGGRIGYYEASEPASGVFTEWEKRLLLNFNFNMNYQYKNLFLGVQVYNSNSFLMDSDLQTRTSISYQNIYIGYQFNAPKKLEKPVNWLEKKLF